MEGYVELLTDPSNAMTVGGWNCANCEPKLSSVPLISPSSSISV